MKETKRQLRYKRSLFSIKSYIFYFLVVCFAITCSILLFLNHLEVDYGTIYESGKLTALNVVVISLILTVIDSLYHKWTVERPMKQILHASEKLIEGDFSVRIAPTHRFDGSTELDIIIENLNRIAEELSSVEMLRSDFVSNVSHEIKTPLSVIQNYASLLQKENLSPQQRQEAASIIANASYKLTELITNILKLNKLENQQIFPKTKEFDLGNQLSECILSFDDLLEKKNLELEADLEEQVKIESDRELLELVWNNLLSNAIKFTPEGGRIGVSLKRAGDMAVVQITDTGCGMSQETGKHIFEKFYQGDTSHATQGNGLGLALVKRVVDIVGGSVMVESELGQGSRFTVRLRQK